MLPSLCCWSEVCRVAITHTHTHTQIRPSEGHDEPMLVLNTNSVISSQTTAVHQPRRRQAANGCCGLRSVSTLPYPSLIPRGTLSRTDDWWRSVSTSATGHLPGIPPAGHQLQAGPRRLAGRQRFPRPPRATPGMSRPRQDDGRPAHKHIHSSSTVAIIIGQGLSTARKNDDRRNEVKYLQTLLTLSCFPPPPESSGTSSHSYIPSAGTRQQNITGSRL